MFDLNTLFSNPQAMQQMDLAMALMSQGKSKHAKGLGQAWGQFQEQNRSSQYQRMMDEAIKSRRERDEEERKERRASLTSMLTPEMLQMMMQDPNMSQWIKQMTAGDPLTSGIPGYMSGLY